MSIKQTTQIKILYKTSATENCNYCH